MKKIIALALIMISQSAFAKTSRLVTQADVKSLIHKEVNKLIPENMMLSDFDRSSCAFNEETDVDGVTTYTIKSDSGIEMSVKLTNEKIKVTYDDKAFGEAYTHTYELARGRKLIFGYIEDTQQSVSIEGFEAKLTCIDLN